MLIQVDSLALSSWSCSHIPEGYNCDSMAKTIKASVFDDVKQARYAGWMIVFLLSGVALLLRLAMDFDGVLDTDVMNFGLAAYRFDVLEHQPHPPGYPGYVVFLKMIHGVMPGLAPVDVAKWGTRITGLLLVPASYWTTRQLLPERIAVREGSWAALIAVFHPILWFYGGDGQSHGAEALLTVILIGLTVHVSRRKGLWPRLLLVFAFALAGSVRPTISFLSSPLLVWVFWGRGFKDWCLAAMVGVSTVLAWYAALIHFAGGLELYRRVTDALVTELFISNFSVFGKRATMHTLYVNWMVTLYSSVLAIIPLLALCWRRAAWFWALGCCVLLNVVFYTLFFAAEPGYLAGVAAMATLVPATWSVTGRGERWRAALVVLVSFIFVWLGPQAVQLPGAQGRFLPTMEHVVSVREAQDFHRELICESTKGEPTLVLTDNPVTTHNRWIAMRCPHVIVAVYIHDFILRDNLDNWLIFRADGMDAIPPPVPLEPGPATEYMLPPVKSIVITPGTSPAWREQILKSASCSAATVATGESGHEQRVHVLPASCLPVLRFGAHTLTISAG